MCPENNKKEECSGHLLAIGDALEVLNGKWKLPIIVALSFGKFRFRDLQREINISPKMLSKELKDLEMQQLVKRTVFDTTPVTVEYSLTEYARTLHDVIEALHNWGMEHRRRVMGKNRAE